MIFYIVIFFVCSILWLIVFQRILENKNKAYWIAFVLGIVAGPFAGYCSMLLKDNILPNKAAHSFFQFEDFIMYFFIVGPVEEFGKFIAALPLALRTSVLKKSTDGMLLGIAVALGFAGGENIVYLLHYGANNTWLRIILGNLGHCGYSVFWGYALGVVFTENASRSIILSGLLMACVLHGAYDYFLSFSLIGFVIALIFSGILFVFLFLFSHKEKKRFSS